MSETRLKPFLDERKLENYSKIFLYAVIFGMCIFHTLQRCKFHKCKDSSSCFPDIELKRFKLILEDNGHG